MNETGKNYYEEDYMPYIIKWGRITNLIGFFLAFGPVLILTFVYGLHPPTSAIIAGAVAQISISGVFWFVEPISYFPILGIPGTYMSFISGNIANLRLPCSAAAQEAAGVEVGTEAGTIISTLGVGVSIIVNVIMLSVGVILGAAIIGKLPSEVASALNLILPALFGAIFAQFAVVQPKVGVVAIIIASIMTFFLKQGYLNFLPGYPSYGVILVSVFATIAIAKKMREKGMIH